MDTKEFKLAVDLLVKERGIDKDIIYEALELALTSAYKKNYHSLPNVRVEIDDVAGKVKVVSFMTVVEEVEDDRIELSLEEAQKLVPDIKIGETIEEEVTPKDYMLYSYVNCNSIEYEATLISEAVSQGDYLLHLNKNEKIVILETEG